MKMKILLLLLFFLTTSGKLMMQEIPDCWCYPDLDEIYGTSNIDWAIDTCSTVSYGYCDSNFISSYEKEGRRENLFAKRGWIIVFKNNDVLPSTSSTITIFNWEDISDDYPQIKEDFKALEDTFGNYHFLSLLPDIPDSIIIHPFEIIFDNYVNILAIQHKLRQMDSIYCDYQWISFPASITDKNKSIEIIRLNPNPVNNNLKLEIDNLQSYNTSIKLYNILGNCVYNEEIINNDDSLEYSINTSGLNSGLYFLKVNNTIYKVLVLRQ